MRIRERIIKQIIAHAKKDSPLEACGYLAAKDGVIAEFYALNNIDKSSEHFSFDPKEQFCAVKDMRAKNLQLCAVYHSHPASPARPSDEDIKLAFDPDILYVIVSLAAGRKDVQAYKIINQKVEPVYLEAIADEGV